MAQTTRPPRRTNQERSRETRTRLLEATVQCLYEVGYAATTGKLAIERAGLSRGAALHHFPSRVDLIIETAAYIIKEQNAYRNSLRNPEADPRQRLMDTLDVVWKSWSRPHAIALLEILIGSRSDPELASRFPEIDREIADAQRERFWAIAHAAGMKDRHASDVMVVMGVALMRGLAIERMNSPDSALIGEAFQMFKEMRDRRIAELIDEA